MCFLEKGLIFLQDEEEFVKSLLKSKKVPLPANCRRGESKIMTSMAWLCKQWDHVRWPLAIKTKDKFAQMMLVDYLDFSKSSGRTPTRSKWSLTKKPLNLRKKEISKLQPTELNIRKLVKKLFGATPNELIISESEYWKREPDLWNCMVKFGRCWSNWIDNCGVLGPQVQVEFDFDPSTSDAQIIILLHFWASQVQKK